MQIDNCLILAAGFGTRMGDIGKELPKVLWPVFEKSLLHLQVAYAKYLGVKNVYINIHHMSSQILESVKSDSAFEDVIFLKEDPEILDIGGAVHNLASQKDVGYRGKLLILNADQFFFITKKQFENIIKLKHSKILLTYKVNSSDGYNALEIDDDSKVRSIIQNKNLPQGSEVLTYTGISIIDLKSLDKSEGVSRFFDSVCDFKKGDVYSYHILDQSYWDFGTMERYWNTMFKILKLYRVESQNPFIRFLVESKAIKTWKIDLKNCSYNALSSNVINLNSDYLNSELPSCILLSGIPKGELRSRFIFRDPTLSYLESF